MRRHASLLMIIGHHPATGNTLLEFAANADASAQLFDPGVHATVLAMIFGLPDEEAYAYIDMARTALDETYTGMTECVDDDFLGTWQELRCYLLCAPLLASG